MHWELWEAGASAGEWQAAREILEPMVKTAEAIGNESLVKVLEEALDRVKCEILYCSGKENRLEAEL